MDERVHCVTHCVTPQLPWRDLFLPFLNFILFREVARAECRCEGTEKWMGLRWMVWKTQRINKIFFKERFTTHINLEVKWQPRHGMVDWQYQIPFFPPILWIPYNWYVYPNMTDFHSVVNVSPTFCIYFCLGWLSFFNCCREISCLTGVLFNLLAPVSVCWDLGTC